MIVMCFYLNSHLSHTPPLEGLKVSHQLKLVNQSSINLFYEIKKFAVKVRHFL